MIVATVLTACGIETQEVLKVMAFTHELQQCLPLAVLKLYKGFDFEGKEEVATVLTACGIETSVAALKNGFNVIFVATVLTACGIETRSLLSHNPLRLRCNSAYRLRY